MAVAIEEWLSQGDALLPLWRTILWALVAYLLALSVAVLGWPRRAHSFLDGFAVGWRNNLLEAVLRGLAGLSFIAAASTTRAPEASRAIGLFLIATAMLMALLPHAHARIAGPAKRFVFAILPLFGLMALALAAILGWFIIPG